MSTLLILSPGNLIHKYSPLDLEIRPSACGILELVSVSRLSMATKMQSTQLNSTLEETVLSLLTVMESPKSGT